MLKILTLTGKGLVLGRLMKDGIQNRGTKDICLEDLKAVPFWEPRDDVGVRAVLFRILQQLIQLDGKGSLVAHVHGSGGSGRTCSIDSGLSGFFLGSSGDWRR